ncbi:MAG: gamma-glutamylcyclotransferase [Actinobacteria bacterium]|nr:gamma-glutamylcyclotransferase [Actinomycetota bacterium]
MEGTSKLFVYGTLLVDDVVNTLIGRIPHYLVAKAPGWRIVRLPQKVYPGLVPGQGEADGKVFTDLTNAEWAILDAFEDPAYTLAAVRVLAPLGMDAFAYVWRGEHVDKPWSTVDFEGNELADYVDLCRNWRRRYDQRADEARIVQSRPPASGPLRVPIHPAPRRTDRGQ